MSTRTLETLATDGAFFEAPRWHDGRWWVSDFYRHRVIAVDPAGAVEVVAEVPAQPSGLGWLPDGDLLIVAMNDRSVLRRRADGTLAVHADLSALAAGPLNDMTVDAHGRAYVGNFGFDLFGGEDLRGADLIRVDPDGSARVVARDLVFPNGAALTADGRTLIVGETFAGRYTAFTVDVDGELRDRRVWAQIGEAPPYGQVADMEAALSFTPDGCAIDAEDRIWATDIHGGRCCLLCEGGAVEDQIDAPAGLSFFACALGGPDGRTLLLCAAPDYQAERRAANYEAVLLTTMVDVPGA
jgi:sugar lactone lactonase YvrE